VKYILTLVALLAAGTFLCLANLSPGEATAFTRIPEYTWDEVDAIHAERAKLDTRWRDQEHFEVVRDAAKRDLREGRASLAEAADVVVAAAEQHNRLFLEAMRERHPDLSQREGVALVLLGHFRVEFADTKAPDVGALLDHLSCELWSWPDVSPVALAALTEPKR
jgi:hypothetical protein